MLLIPGCGVSSQVKAPVLTPAGPVVEPDAPAGPVGPDTTGPRRPPRRLDGPLRGRTGAHLTLSNAAAAVDLRLAALPGLLYRIQTPADSGLSPRVTGPAGVVDLRLAPTGDDGSDRVHILLNREVVWHIRLTGGAGEHRLDLAGGRLSGVVLGGGAGLVRLRLPHPHGTAPIRFTGAVGALEVMVPAGVPVRVRLARGATAVRLPWPVRAPVRAGTVLTAPTWPAASSRYAIDSRSTVGSLTVSAR